MRERQSRASIDSVHEYFGKLISNAYPFKPEMGDASNNAKLQKKPGAVLPAAHKHVGLTKIIFV